MRETIKSLSIDGFKSIRALKDFKLRPLNVLIGETASARAIS